MITPQPESIQEVTLQQANRLHQIAIAFDQECKKEKANFQSSKTVVYYLVSCKYIREWFQYCTSESLKRIKPKPMNSDLVADNLIDLRGELREEIDFQILTQESYITLKEDFQVAAELMRIAYFQNGQKKVPIYTLAITYTTLTKKELSDKMDKKNFIHKFKTVTCFSGRHTVKQFLDNLPGLKNNFKGAEFRVWLVQEGLGVAGLFQQIRAEVRDKSHSLASNGFRLNNFGQSVLDLQTELEKLGIGLREEKFVIIEIAANKNQFVSLPTEAQCSYCFKSKELTRFCGCQKVAYCSAACEDRDKLFHIKKCSFAFQEEKNRIIGMRKNPNSLQGLVGLDNLGNTCFMNSCLQCLSHTLPLTNYFLEGRFNCEINRQNVLGSQGRLAKAYAQFIEQMWCKSDRSYSPYKLKSQVASINSRFSGYSQHDSHEFLTFLIDGIHEDLSRISSKPSTQIINGNGKLDSVVAKESWVNYLRREQSIIVDMMTGQYKSKVTCPTCRLDSITFDPFITVSLPIPNQPALLVEYYVLFQNNEQKTKKMSVLYQQNFEYFLEKAVKALGRKKQQLRFYFLTYNEDVYSLNNMSTEEFQDKVRIEKKILFLIELTEEETQYERQVEIITKMCKSSHSNFYEPVWFKRPFFFELEATTGLEIVKKLLRYLYHDTYPKSMKRYEGKYGVSGQPYESYEEQMLRERPFQLIFKWGKKTEQYYTKKQIIFTHFVTFEDNMKLSDFMRDKEPNDVQLEVRFDKNGIEKYEIARLTEFVDQTKSTQAVQKKTVTLRDCFQKLQKPEKLEPGNQWYCPSCKIHRQALKELKIYKIPEVLILHLKRFSTKNSRRSQKDSTPVEFCSELDLTDFVTDPLPMDSYNSFAEEAKVQCKSQPEKGSKLSDRPIYELYAISNHFGGLGGGHYTAYAKNSGKWYSFNDSSVKEVSQEQIRSKPEAPYILFYKRKAVIKQD